MKKTAFLILTLAVLLSACSAPPQADPSTAAQPTALTQPSGQAATELTEPASEESTASAPEEAASGLRLLAVFDESSPGSPVSMAVSEEEAVILLAGYPEGGSPEPVQYFQFVDLDRGCLTDPVPVEVTENGNLDQIAYAPEGGLLLSNAYLETAARYDREGRLLETLPSQIEPRPEFDHELMNSWFTVVNRDYAYYHCYEGNGYLYSAYAFADAPEALYLLAGGYDAVADARGHRILESDYLQNGAGLQYRVLDLDAGILEDDVTIPNDAPPELAAYTYLNADTALLCGDRALLKVAWTQYDPVRYENGEYGEGEEVPPAWQVRIYDWKLRADGGAPMDVQRVTEAELYQTSAELINGMTRDYPLELLIGTEPDDEASATPFYDGESLSEACRRAELTPLRSYELLLQLQRFLEELPTGFLAEMQSDFPGTAEESGFSGLDIFLVREIPGDSAAYANSNGQRLSVCFAVDEFSPSLLPHEFMHLMECRIHAWYEARGESFREQWDALNPPEAGETASADWFVSSYARTDSMEDRAETFARLFLEPGPLEEADWYRDHPHVQEKVRLLTEAIRNAYPSVESTNGVYWENK